MTVTLDEETAAVLQSEIDRGAFTSPEEAIAAATRLMTMRDPLMEAWLIENREEVNKLLDEAEAEAQRGEFLTPEESMIDLERHRLERKRIAA